MINRIINWVADRLTGLRLGELIWGALAKVVRDKSMPMTKAEVDDLIRREHR